MKNDNILSPEDALAIREFSHRAPIYLSPDGEWMAYTVRAPSQRPSIRGPSRSPSGVLGELIGSEVWVTEIEGGSSRNLTEGWGTSWSAGWSPDGNRLLFLSDREEVVRAWMWNKDIDEYKLVCDQPVNSFFGYDVPIWSPDGSRIILRIKAETDTSVANNKASQEDSAGQPSNVLLFRSIDAPKKEELLSERLTPSGKRVSKQQDAHLCDIVMLDVQSGHMKRLAEGFRVRGIALSHDGSKLAVLSMEGRSNGMTLYSVYVSSVEEGALQLVDDGIAINENADGTAMAWSPDDRYVALTTHGRGRGNLLLYDTEEHQLKKSYSRP